MTHLTTKIAGTSSNTAALEWHRLTGPAFEDALSGTGRQGASTETAAWLESPKLKYFWHRSPLVRGEDNRVFFLATLPGAGSQNKHLPVAAIEVDLNEDQAATLGIKYVTVHEDWRRQGLALRLYTMLVEHLKDHNLKLYRTRPGTETPPDFTASVTQLLTLHGVDWYSSRLL